MDIYDINVLHAELDGKGMLYLATEGNPGRYDSLIFFNHLTYLTVASLIQISLKRGEFNYEGHFEYDPSVSTGAIFALTYSPCTSPFTMHKTHQ